MSGLKQWYKKLFICMTIIAMFALAGCGSNNNNKPSPSPSPETGISITFNVTVPEGSIPEGANVTIGGTVNSWNPQDTKWYATKIDDTHYQITKAIEVNVGDTIQYKWTQQRPAQTAAWSYEEGDQSGNYRGNRTYTVISGKNIINDTVLAFRNTENAPPTITNGTLKTVTLEMAQLNRTRTVRIWLPEGYDSADTSKTYPVMYMHDGQNLFDANTSFLGEWQADEAINTMMTAGYGGAIVVGIDNGGESRFNELSPPWIRSSMGSTYITAPVGDQYARFIVETVKPYIDQHYLTKSDRAHTGIGGSSMGGIMSFYMAMEYPNTFGYAMVFSPALHIYANGTIQNYIASKDFSNTNGLPKIYLYSGAALGNSDSGTPYDETYIDEYIPIIETALNSHGYPSAKYKSLIDQSQAHIESAWAQNFPTAYRWLVGF